MFGARAPYCRPIGEEKVECENVRRDDGIRESGAVRCSGYDTSEGLLRDGAEIGHGEPMRGERGVESVEGDAALGGNMLFLRVDLRGRTGTGVSRFRNE